MNEQNGTAAALAPAKVYTPEEIRAEAARAIESIRNAARPVERFARSGKDELVILILSDLDPEGESIAETFAESMRFEFEIEQRVRAVRVALTREQVERFQLVSKQKAKAKSSRRKGFVERHGSDVVYELEALAPEIMQRELARAIDNELDIDAFNREIEQEKQDAAELESTRRAIVAMLRGGA